MEVDQVPVARPQPLISGAEDDSDVDSFEGKRLGGYRYILLLCTWVPYSDDLSGAVDKDRRNFGEDLGSDGLVISPYRGSTKLTLNQVATKFGDEGVYDEIRKAVDPFLLVIEEDFDTFDPAVHKWGILFFRGVDPDDVPRIFKRLAQAVGSDEDLFAKLDRLRRHQVVKERLRFFELKAGGFGFSVDLKELIDSVLDVA